MIRRNHTDKNIFNDKYALKYRNKQHHQENSLIRKQINRNQIQSPYDQNFKAVSNNKKYHQYKEERQLKIKKNQKQIKNDVPTNTLSLSQSIYQQKNRENSRAQKNLLKREYNYEPQVKEQTQRFTNIEKIHNEEKIIAKRPQIHQKRNKDSLNYSYGCNTDRSISRPSTQKYPKFQSIKRNEILNHIETPSFNQQHPLKKERSQNVSIDFAKRRQHSTQFYLKTDYDSLRYEKNSTDKIKLNKILSQPYRLKISPPQAIPRKIQIPFNVQPSLKPQQVCLKLQQISEFNSQINQRIKGIIGGFESIKNKL